tara:strand:- start:194 stop:742 length:549 start_codon:yes stop_codon:yes gene_type:complete
MKIFKTHEFTTKVYEGRISFDQNKVLRLLKSLDNIMQESNYMRTTFLKEKNILLYKDFKFLLDSCTLFYNYVAQENSYKTGKVTASWFQIYDKGNFHDTHIHNISNRVYDFWNFIFYINCPAHSSNTIILEPGYPYIDSNKRLTIKPTVGGCVGFPGHLPHFVEPNRSSRRIILSSNVEFRK